MQHLIEQAHVPGAAALARALTLCQKLRRLDLSQCNISCKGAKALADALQQGTQLQVPPRSRLIGMMINVAFRHKKNLLGGQSGYLVQHLSHPC